MNNPHPNSIFKGIHGDLVEFADRISHVLGCPVTIEDANHRVLAYSIHDDLSDPVRISTIMNRRVPEKIINNLWKEGVIPSLLKDDSPIIIPSMSELGFGKRAAVSIRKNQEVIGFIWVLEINKSFTETDLNFLKLAAKEGKNQLLQALAKKKRNQESHQEFLWQLLTGHFDTEDDIKSVCAENAISLPSIYSIIVFTFPSTIDESIERNISYTIGTTQKIKAPLYTIDQRRLIIVASPANQNDFTQSLTEFIDSFLSQMKVRFELTNIHGACGPIYSTYIQASTCYQEARYTLSLQQVFPNKEKQLTNYATLGIYQYVQTLYHNRTTNIFQQNIKELFKYDEKNSTNLIETLQTYLEHDANPYDTASKLHLHVNTIHYRLKRISSIANINVKDPLQKMALYLEFLLQQYENYIKSKKSDTFSS
ncbi:helix-turn-helix domain-containing protein [Bacillus massiliigorillae]|uniref:helix-turn-helix domain-containing protein n=1 Tax=Bacillus massiliigorillae TaxID=1243664 RepID=UPI0003AA1D50|nr:helix-turn-helix domain-containing protein [Bacillus massiliigorillae]